MESQDDIRAKLEADTDRKIAQAFNLSDEDISMVKHETSFVSILESVRQAMKDLTTAHLCVSWATLVPAEKHKIYDWCMTLGIPPATIYAYTWQDKDYYIIPEWYLLKTGYLIRG